MLANYLAFDVIGSFSFGRPFGFIEKGNDPYNLIHTIDMRGETLNALGSLTPWLRPLMKYHFLDPFWPSGLRATANLEKIGREAFLRRKQNADDRCDLLSYLFAAADEKNEDPIDENEIIAESISFIVGGSDTTSSTMSNFIDMVSRNPAIQSQLQQELDETFPGQQADYWVPEEREVSKLRYLNAVLREVMRLRPTSATGLERVTPSGGKSVAGKFIPENVRAN
jgi:benzoate 4-monooxygenase